MVTSYCIIYDSGSWLFDSRPKSNLLTTYRSYKVKKLFMAAFLGLAILATATSGGVALAAPLSSITQVMEGVYDDGYTVFIVAGSTEGPIDGRYGRVVYLMKKKSEWQKRFPKKKIVAMAVVSDGNFGVSGSSGLLIHYEQK